MRICVNTRAYTYIHVPFTHFDEMSVILSTCVYVCRRLLLLVDNFVTLTGDGKSQTRTTKVDWKVRSTCCNTCECLHSCAAHVISRHQP